MSAGELPWDEYARIEFDPSECRGGIFPGYGLVIRDGDEKYVRPSGVFIDMEEGAEAKGRYVACALTALVGCNPAALKPLLEAAEETLKAHRAGIGGVSALAAALRAFRKEET